jgi:uncharacterized integral membrane protein
MCVCITYTRYRCLVLLCIYCVYIYTQCIHDILQFSTTAATVAAYDTVGTVSIASCQYSISAT